MRKYWAGRRQTGIKDLASRDTNDKEDHRAAAAQA